MKKQKSTLKIFYFGICMIMCTFLVMSSAHADEEMLNIATLEIERTYSVILERVNDRGGKDYFTIKYILDERNPPKHNRGIKTFGDIIAGVQKYHPEWSVCSGYDKFPSWNDLKHENPNRYILLKMFSKGSVQMWTTKFNFEPERFYDKRIDFDWRDYTFEWMLSNVQTFLHHQMLPAFDKIQLRRNTGLCSSLNFYKDIF